MDRAIPPFYCCYLLRSTTTLPSKSPALYIGSTPNPRRRLKQHNGLTKGGAKRTKRVLSQRPWEMAVIVAGFPSHIAALQFEWAWQNPHITRHIPSKSRITTAKKVDRQMRNGTMRKKVKRPRYYLVECLRNLQLLLHVETFARWPLSIKFFARDAYEKWLHKDVAAMRQLPEDFSVTLEIGTAEQVEGEMRSDKDVAPGIDVVQLTEIEAFEQRPSTRALYASETDYTPAKPHLQQSLSLLDGTRSTSCVRCSAKLHSSSDLVLVCPNKQCNATSHLKCLSEHMLMNDMTPTALVPTSGSCPSCMTQLQWTDLVKDLSLRMRGEVEIRQLLKEPRKKKVKGTIKHAAIAAGDEGAYQKVEEDIPVRDEEDDATEDDLEYDASFAEQESDMAINSDDIDRDDGESDDEIPLPKAKSAPVAMSRKACSQGKTVVLDSEYDDIDDIASAS